MSLSKNFFDMDLNYDDIIQEGTETGSMDFDFDDDSETEEVEVDDKLSPDQVDEFYGKLKDELGQDDASSENVEADANKASSANEYEQKYLDQLRKEKDLDPLQKLELAINSKLPKDFAEGVSIFDNNDFANAEIKDDNGKVVFCVEGMFPLKRIISERKANNYHLDNDKLFAIGSDGLGNAIVMNTDDWCYYIWYHDTKETLLIAKAFDNDGVDPGYDISENDTLLGKLGHVEPTAEEPVTEEEPATDDAGDQDLDTETVDDTTEEVGDGNEEVTQESMFDSGFSNLRSGIANALKDTKYKVSNIVRGMLGKDMFTVSDDNTTTTIDSMGNGCKVVTRDGKGKMKVNFNNISLSEALKKIVELFQTPEHILEGAIMEEVVQEADEPSDDDTVEKAIEKENAPNEEPRTEETVEEDGEIDFDFGAPASTEDALADSETPEGNDLSTFGTDTSDVQNEYDPKEIEILNKLVAAEAEAINDYFDAAKDSHDSNARRLYSDIGHEERFHMEQLLFQKAQFTGEKYEPRDPEVKKEYEELLQMGMDDATAMHTAIDKTVISTNDGSYNEFDFDFLEYSTNNLLTMLHQNEIILEAGMYAYEHRADKMAQNYAIILESYFYQEEVMNTAKAPKELKGPSNPFTLLLKAFKGILNGLSELTTNIRESSEKSRIRRHARLEWIKKNGIDGLFKSGKWFYFYNDTDSAFNMVIPVQYVDLLYRLSVDIGKKCGVNVTPQGYHGTIKNPIRYNSIEDGMAKISKFDITKSKVIVNDKNREALVNEFFGYSDKKINVKVWNEEANRAIYESNNVYNKLICFAAITRNYAEVTNQILEVMQGLQGNMNSIYYKDRVSYNKYLKYMQTIVNVYTQLTKAAISDLTEMRSLDKDDVASVTAARDAGGKLPEGAEDRRTSGSNGNNRAEKKFAKTKK